MATKFVHWKSFDTKPVVLEGAETEFGTFVTLPEYPEMPSLFRKDEEADFPGTWVSGDKTIWEYDEELLAMVTRLWERW